MIYEVVLNRLYHLRNRNAGKDQALDRKIISIIRALPKSLHEYKFAVNLENLKLVEPEDPQQPEIEDPLDGLSE